MNLTSLGQRKAMTRAASAAPARAYGGTPSGAIHPASHPTIAQTEETDLAPPAPPAAPLPPRMPAVGDDDDEKDAEKERENEDDWDDVRMIG